MKNYIIILLCLSLLLCGCQAAGNGTGTEPTVVPTEEPTQEPTQEPTLAPTEPPLPAGAINVQPKWASTVKSSSKPPVYKGGYNRLSWSGLLHSVDDIQTFLQDTLGEYELYYDIDYSAYDAAFFENNSIAVFLAGMKSNSEWLLNFTESERLTEGNYEIEFEIYIGIGVPEETFAWCLIFLEMKDVTDNADVEFICTKEDFVGGIDHVEHTPMTIYAWIGDIAPGINESDMKEK